MKKNKFKLKSIFFLMALTLLFSCEKENVDTDISEKFEEVNSKASPFDRVLTHDSFLRIRPDLSLWFKAGTHVSFHNNGNVKKAVLYYAQYLLISGVGQRGSLQTKGWFKPGTAIHFDINGHVLKGTLAENSFLPIGWGNSGKKLWFKGGTEIRFGYGVVASAVLLNNSFISVTGYTRVWFRKHYRVDFDFYGNAASGNLVNLNSSPIGNGTKIWFRSWTTITYDGETGYVLSGTLHKRTYLKLAFDNSNRWFDAGTFVELDSNGRVTDYFPY